MTLLEAIGNIIGSVLGLIICLVLNQYNKGKWEMSEEELEEYNICICCPYFFDGYCHNCTHEDCEKEMLDKENKE